MAKKYERIKGLTTVISSSDWAWSLSSWVVYDPDTCSSEMWCVDVDTETGVAYTYCVETTIRQADIHVDTELDLTELV